MPQFILILKCICILEQEIFSLPILCTFEMIYLKDNSEINLLLPHLYTSLDKEPFL